MASLALERGRELFRAMTVAESILPGKSREEIGKLARELVELKRAGKSVPTAPIGHLNTDKLAGQPAKDVVEITKNNIK